MHMYTIKTRDNVIKEIKDLSPEEIKDAIRFNTIKRRQKTEQIIEKRCKILDLESKQDELQIEISALREEVEKEVKKQLTIDKLLTLLDKGKKEQKFEEVWKNFEQEQLID